MSYANESYAPIRFNVNLIEFVTSIQTTSEFKSISINLNENGMDAIHDVGTTNMGQKMSLARFEFNIERVSNFSQP